MKGNAKRSPEFFSGDPEIEEKIGKVISDADGSGSNGAQGDNWELGCRGKEPHEGNRREHPQHGEFEKIEIAGGEASVGIFENPSTAQEKIYGNGEKKCDRGGEKVVQLNGVGKKNEQ